MLEGTRQVSRHAAWAGKKKILQRERVGIADDSSSRTGTGGRRRRGGGKKKAHSLTKPRDGKSSGDELKPKTSER